MTKLWVSRNGIETSFYEGKIPEKKPWVIYSSSPDRGLDVLLECWPEIRKRVPEAELHYGYAPYYEQARQAFPHLQAFHRKIENLQKEQGSLHSFGSLGQRELAALYKQSKVWAYPSAATPTKAMFPEIHCISAVEAQAAGCIPVCADYGALKETVQTEEWRIAPDLKDGVPSPGWKARFVDRVALALRSEPDPAWRGWALTQDWSGVVDAWEAHFLSADREAVAA
jgi:glycosyltransferase involved in cell wall biosynthesis